MFKIVSVVLGIVAYSVFLNGAMVDAKSDSTNYSSNETAQSTKQQIGVFVKEIASSTTSVFELNSFKSNSKTSLEGATLSFVFSTRFFLNNINQYLASWTNTLVRIHYLDFIFPFHHFW